jgi:hypothetical protein
VLSAILRLHPADGTLLHPVPPSGTPAASPLPPNFTRKRHMRVTTLPRPRGWLGDREPEP